MNRILLAALTVSLTLLIGFASGYQFSQNQTAAPTLPPPKVSLTTQVPPTPTLPPSNPTPAEPCRDPAIGEYLNNSNALLLEYSQLSSQFQQHFNAGDKDDMRTDLDTAGRLTAAIESLTPPPLYQKYHALFSTEVRGFTDILAAILADNTDLAVALVDKINEIDAQRMAEFKSIQQYCHLTKNSQSA